MNLSTIINSCLNAVDYKIRSSSFTALSKEADKDHPQEIKDDLILFTRIFSLMLAPDDEINPFHPLATYTDGSTSFSLSDLKDEDIEKAKALSPNIVDPLARAHLQDISWVKSRKNYEEGLNAIDSYLSFIHLTFSKSELEFTLPVLKRSIALINQLGQTEKHSTSLIESVFNHLEKGKSAGNIKCATDLLALFLDTRLSAEQLTRAIKIANQIFSELVDTGDPFLQHQVMNIAFSFARKANDQVAANKYLLESAKVFESAAEIQTEGFELSPLIRTDYAAHLASYSAGQQ